MTEIDLLTAPGFALAECDRPLCLQFDSRAGGKMIEMQKTKRLAEREGLGLARSRSTLLHQRGSALADFLDRHFEAMKLLLA
jgi:hypothetical protein